jgi:hypothetical protein
VQLNTIEEARAYPPVCTGGLTCKSKGAPDGAWPHIHTLEGDHTWREGDWCITGVNGEHYFCKPDIFTKTYEPAHTQAGEALTAAQKAGPVLLEALREIRDLDGEINPNNYDHDDVCNLNSQFIRSYEIADDAIAQTQEPSNER